MSKDDKATKQKTATTEAPHFIPQSGTSRGKQNGDEAQNEPSQNLNASGKLSDSEVAMETLRKKNVELEDQVKRLLADYQNLVKRTETQRTEIIQMANRELLLRLLPALDTLMLAGKHIKDEGLRLSVAQFQDALRQEGVEKIETVGKQFDPHTMECFETVEGEEGKVVEEAFAGYKLFDKIIRPAQVKVGKKS